MRVAPRFPHEVVLPFIDGKHQRCRRGLPCPQAKVVFLGGDAIRRRAMELRGRRVIVLGERDGVQGGAIAHCAARAGGQVVLEKTYCFV